ncbi:hypothetical protein PRIPAC_79060, partial [Pristionchus pacificus]|uniref:Membrane transporter n=1 Tax=Pristionchus pacificus TaxID=54126 RepID=A0A2A6CPW6_PRIPA
MIPHRYATLCAILCGIGNLLLWSGFDANVFISEAVLHSVNQRAPERIGAHDGYYGMAVTNVVFMFGCLVAPSLSSYLRGKWILTLSAVLFFVYFFMFQIINRYLYFTGSAILGIGFATFYVGYTGYLTEFSTKETIERNTAVSWGVSSFSYAFSAIVNLAVTLASQSQITGTTHNYREYSDTEIRYFFSALAFLSFCAIALFISLPSKGVEENIAASNVTSTSFVEQYKVMQSVLVHPGVLLLASFYFYHGLFFVFFTSIIPTTFQFTEVLSRNVYIPAIIGFAFTVGSFSMSIITVKCSSAVHNFSFEPLTVLNAVLHFVIYAITICVIPQWSTVYPNDEPSMVVQPNVFFVILLYILFGAADIANNTTRIVITSLLIPEKKQQTFGASKFYHALAACLLLFVAPALSIYVYAGILTAFLVYILPKNNFKILRADTNDIFKAVSTFAFLYACYLIRKGQRMQKEDTDSEINAKSVTRANKISDAHCSLRNHLCYPVRNWEFAVVVRIGAHDGYYGMAVTNIVFMFGNLVVPSLSNYFRGKWILTLTSALFLLYFLMFQLINRYLFFAGSALLGIAFSTFFVGYTGYLTEFSTRETIERNTSLSWGVSSFGYLSSAIINLGVIIISQSKESGTVSNYREYSNTEIRYFFAAFALLSVCAIALFASLPHKKVEGNIAAENARTTSFIEQYKMMQSVLIHPRVLILAPFYFYHGLFFSFFTSIIPTAFQFTKAIYGIVVCVIPQWSTVYPNGDPALLVQPTVFWLILLYALFGAADSANNTTRIVISSLLLPESKQQTFGASKFYHALAACLLLFVAPALSIYTYAGVMTTFLTISTILFFVAFCRIIRKEERKAEETVPNNNTKPPVHIERNAEE